MTNTEITRVRDRRLHGTRAAALVGLMGRRSGINVENVSWEALSTLPSWCLDSLAKQQQIQSLCGAVYLTPVIQSSIDGNFLREMRSVVGQSVFDRIRCDESLHVDWDMDPVIGSTESAVSKCGASVLLATLTDSSLRTLFKSSLGDCEIEISKETARYILNHANALAGESSVENASAANT